MVRTSLIIATCFLLGCSYKSVVIRPSKKGNAIIYLGQEPKESQNIQQLKQQPSILSTELDMETYLSQIPKKGERQCSIFLSNSSVFINANAEPYGPFTSIYGYIYRKDEPDTVRFRYYLNDNAYSRKIQKIDVGEYLIKISRDTSNGSVYFPKPYDSDASSLLLVDSLTRTFNSSLTFHLSKTQSFIIENGIMDVLTGEISFKGREPFKYVVINDPDEKYIDHMSFLVTLDLERMERYSEECRKRYYSTRWCPSGYQSNYYWYFFEYRIYCECKK